MYYLQSRYYIPGWGRFNNADATGGKVGTLLSHNVFAYCFNNPVNMADTSGNYPKCLKKVTKSIKKAAVAAYKSLDFEIGAGLGIGFSSKIKACTSLIVEAEATEDVFNLKLSGGKAKFGTKEKASIGIKVDKELGFYSEASNYHSYNNYHFVPFEGSSFDCHGNDTYYNRFNCPNSEHDNELICDFNLGSIKNSDFVVGVGESGYAIIGGNVSIEFNVSKFIRLFKS